MKKQKLTKEQKKWHTKLSNFYDRLQTKNVKTGGNRNTTPPPDRLELYNKANLSLGWPCRYCQEILDVNNISLDHADPKSRGGTNDINNIDFICKRCNTRKGNLNREEFEKLHRFLNSSGNEEMKKLLLTRLAMGGYLFSK